MRKIIILSIIRGIGQDYKACTRPVQCLWSVTDFGGVVDGGAYRSEARSRHNSPPCAVDSEQYPVVVFVPGDGKVTSYRGTDLGWALLVTRESSRGICPSLPF